MDSLFVQQARELTRGIFMGVSKGKAITQQSLYIMKIPNLLPIIYFDAATYNKYKLKAVTT